MNQKKMGLPAFAKATVFAGFLVVAFAGCDQLANLKLDMDEGDSKTTLPAGVVDSGCTPVVTVDATTKHFAKEANCDTPITVYVENKTGAADTFDIFYVYSNVTESDQSLAMGSGSGVSPQMMPDIQFSPSMEENPLHPPVPDGVTEFNNDPSLRPPLLLPAPGEAPPPQSPQYNMGSVTVGSTTRNWTDSDQNTVATTLVAYATTYAGNKVYIWQNGSTLNTTDIQNIMTKFNGCNVINGGSCTSGEYANSIYKMVRDIAGAEWGSQPYSNLLASTESDVHIVYYDISGNGAWGILGYFWSANNYMKSSFAASNEALVFFMDSPTYKDAANGGDVKLNGTLAHEFQHMIHFYQRTIKRGVNSPTWMNEMASMTVEDLVATVVGGAGTGPAFTSNSRLARYVQYPNCNLTIWNSGSGSGACTGWQDSYATSYSFGGFMARQYPGFIQNILTSTQNDMAAVQDAITRAGYTDTWQTAFSRWGATFAFDDTVAGPGSNFAPGYGFTAQGTLQAVDIWGGGVAPDANLGVPPTIYSTPPATLRAYSNVIHKVKADESIANDAVFKQENIVLPTGVKLTVVVTPK